MRIMIATDAWTPQINGVVTTLMRTYEQLVKNGFEVRMITPERRRTLPMPTYPEIRLALFAGRAIRRELDDFAPHCIHIATEGPIGLIVRNYCIKRNMPFTTAYHTQFPEYVRRRFPVPKSWIIALLRWFHRPAVRTMVPTRSMRTALKERGFEDVVIWSRGVLTDVFNANTPHEYRLPRPIWVYAGRVACEKNIEEFLMLPLPGSKVIIGSGPDEARLKAIHTDCLFLGYRFGNELASLLAGADVFIFPSKTDTFGIVMLEAMACGLPVAAFPVTGPIDVVVPGVTGILDNDLAAACSRALDLNRSDCRCYAARLSWSRATKQFLGNLAPRRPKLDEAEMTACR